ncbi:MAG: hypothetical protein R3281_14450, partial [Balneolaceae bacterium]|nr:hypothetical protein [Balneolaceae bacterium]
GAFSKRDSPIHYQAIIITKTVGEQLCQVEKRENDPKFPSTSVKNGYEKTGTRRTSSPKRIAV